MATDKGAGGDSKKKDTNPIPVGERGNVKLIGIAGLVKGEQFSIEVGTEVVVGRSRDCHISLAKVPAAEAITDERELEKHFRTVSRRHMRLYYKSVREVEIEDLSSNGLFLDGERIEGTVVIDDLMLRPHELKLGTSETFAIDFWRLVPKSQVKMVKVKVKKAEGDEAEEEEAAEGEAKPGEGKKGDTKSQSKTSIKKKE